MAEQIKPCQLNKWITEYIATELIVEMFNFAMIWR